MEKELWYISTKSRIEYCAYNPVYQGNAFHFEDAITGEKVVVYEDVMQLNITGNYGICRKVHAFNHDIKPIVHKEISQSGLYFFYGFASISSLLILAFCVHLIANKISTRLKTKQKDK
jgi:hypothetical protein